MNNPLHDLFTKYEKRIQYIKYKPHKAGNAAALRRLVATNGGSHISIGFRTVVRKVLSKVHLKGKR